MKTIPAWLTATLLSLGTLPAMAQTGLRIEGLLDLGLNASRTPGASTTERSLSSGLLGNSHLALSGAEDLGGGLGLRFRLATDLRADTGAAARSESDALWSRSAALGLRHTRYGSLDLGRLPTALWLSTQRFNALGESLAYSPSARHWFTTVTGDTDWNQALHYQSPSLGGWRLGLAAATRTGNGGNWSAQADYAGGPFSAALVLQQVKKDTSSASVADSRAVQLGAAWDFGRAQAFAQWGQVQNLTTTLDHSIGGLGLRVPLASGHLVAQWSRYAPELGLERDTAAAGYVHTLSRRTQLYGLVLSDRVQGLSGGGGLAVGLRHSF